MAIQRKLIAGISSLLGLLLSSGVRAAAEMNMRPGVTETSIEAYELHMMVIWIMVAISVVVFGAMIYSFIFHRKSKNPTPATFSHSTRVEFIWTIIPIIILIYLTIPAVKLLIKMEDASEAEMSIQVTGSQWKWHYKYLEHEIDFFSNLDRSLEINDPNYLLAVDNHLVIPAGTKVRFLVTAQDVIHSWWVPDLAVKKDAIPGFINETWTLVPENAIGETFRGQCTELCGKDHGFMPVVVDVVSKADFAKWVEHKAEERKIAEIAAAEAASQSWDMDKLMALGKTTYDVKCAACHQISGEGIPPAFPALKGSSIATGPVEGHMNIVVNGKQETSMAAYGPQLTDAELAAVITYERNAWGNNTGDKVQPADIQAFKAGN
jgi:cytochrome c oxidase subunit 2